jgi:hypothetical protein
MSFLLNQWYTLTRPVTLNPIEVVEQDGSTDSTAARSMVLDAGLDYFVVAEENGLATIAFNLEGQDDDENPLPFEMTVKTSELGMGQSVLVSLNEEDPYDEVTDGLSGEELQIASEEDEFDDTAVASNAKNVGARKRRVVRSKRGHRVAKRAARGSHKARRGGGSGFLRMPSRNGMTYCLGEVRINAKHICGQTMPMISRAANGYDAYRAAGWKPINMGSNWSSYPKCTACFWGGGRTDCKGGACGHTALKGGGNMWVGAGVRAVPRLSDRKGCSRSRRGKVVCRVPYKFHGCVVAPGFG